MISTIDNSELNAPVREEVLNTKDEGLTNLSVIRDDVEDELGHLLRQLNTIPTWTKGKIDLYGDVEKEAKRQNYKSFKGDCRRYPLQRKGDHILCDVPENKRGSLSVFRGKRIRLICAGSWDQYSGRFYFAKPITVKGA